ncbi:pyridoxal phosphate-dependent aminotransferase [Haloimpatiens sp. FM7315]|uniref:pyridoxal phosphate-dependent aminotransferase n=1 Tax=Haloimpatiens sp. FM7315 TaxID=3298609 RepID=UPI0035A3BF5B
MVSTKMYEYGSKRSCIRDLFEFGKKQKAIVGKDNVFDFSLGNPSIPAPESVKDAILSILNEETPVAIHSYSSAQGHDSVRDAIASSLNKNYGTNYTKNNLFMTCGAAPTLMACFKALICDDESEIMAIAPYFPEYKCFVEASNGKLTVVPADTKSFQIHFEELEKLINKNTQAIIINSPNNPSGVVYTEETIEKLSAILTEKSKELGHPIYLISDEPYRELAYNGVKVPFVPSYYKNTIVCYSYSKSLSLPGERIGYALVPSEVEDFEMVYASIAGGARASGHVCAPTLFQRVIEKCVDVKPNLETYEKNRNLLYDSFTKMGYNCAKPDGAFYLFFEAPKGYTALEFSEKAKKQNVLIVPGDDFGCPNHLRLSYCVTTEQIEKALPIFENLIK